MSDLYAINLHLQERLEREWREEVRAAEAAVWLDDAGLLGATGARLQEGFAAAHSAARGPHGGPAATPRSK